MQETLDASVGTDDSASAASAASFGGGARLTASPYFTGDTVNASMSWNSLTSLSSCSCSSVSSSSFSSSSSLPALRHLNLGRYAYTRGRSAWCILTRGIFDAVAANATTYNSTHSACQSRMYDSVS